MAHFPTTTHSRVVSTFKSFDLTANIHGTVISSNGDGRRKTERSGDHDGWCHCINLFLRTSNLYSLNQTSTRERKTGEILLLEYGTEASENFQTSFGRQLIFSVQTPQAPRIGFTGIRHATCYPNHRGHWHIYLKQSAEFPQINCYRLGKQNEHLKVYPGMEYRIL
ncbi:uncharacterized protein LOC142522203 [Primulina tabacum]|uniref:uncharacterized protein LOC142522203 n=1 Tax=Primulina tabacum TaxID=48773 RepID=UPI003F599211